MEIKSRFVILISMSWIWTEVLRFMEKRLV